MPTIITQGAASAKGFGFGRSGGGGTLQTVTFTSNSTWVAPAGVSSVATASGKGADGTPAYDYWTYGTPGGIALAYATGPLGISGTAVAPPTYAEVTGYANASLASINSGSGVRRVTYYPVFYQYDAATNRTTPWSGVWGATVNGTGTPSGSAWSNTSSNPVLATGEIWNFNISYLATAPATTGASATALGLTFPGGTGGPATTTTFTNVAVTPGGSYSIVVPSGGTITLQYYA